MSNIKICLYPSFVGELIASKAIQIPELDDKKKLSSILSDLSVNKIAYLNTQAMRVGIPGDKEPRATKLLLLDQLIHCAHRSDIVSPIGYNTTSCIISSLTRVGDEGIIPALYNSLHNYALRFEVQCIKPKIYAIVFKQLCQVASPRERLQYHLEDVTALIKEISMELTDKELLTEPLYRYYLSLM